MIFAIADVMFSMNSVPVQFVTFSKARDTFPMATFLILYILQKF